jgi:hypothetical protein
VQLKNHLCCLATCQGTGMREAAERPGAASALTAGLDRQFNGVRVRTQLLTKECASESPHTCF